MHVENVVNFGKHSLQFEKRGTKDYTFLTLLYPLNSPENDLPEIRLFERKPYRQVVVRFEDTRLVYYLNRGMEFKLDEIHTDAEWVAAIYQDESLTSALMYQGSFLQLGKISATLSKQSSVEIDNKGMIQPLGER